MSVNTGEPVRPGFTRWLWLLAQTDESSREHDLARDVWLDPDWPQDAHSLDELMTYLESRHAADGVDEALARAYTRWMVTW